MRACSNLVEHVLEMCYWRDMKEEHLAAAHSLAASDIPSEDLFEESSFASKFPDQTFTKMEREWIAAEAWAMRGNEHYDWLSVGLLVGFYTIETTGRQLGLGEIESIIVEGEGECQETHLMIRRCSDLRVFKVFIGNVRQYRVSV